MWPFKSKLPDTKFVLNDKVEVVSGFYKGNTGIVRRYSDIDYPKENYMIVFDKIYYENTPEIQWIYGKYLKKLEG